MASRFNAGGHAHQTGNTDHNTIEEHEFASTGNFNDFGDLSTTRNEVMSMSNSTRGVVAGGNNPNPFNVIEYITMSSENGVDFGDLSICNDFLCFRYLITNSWVNVWW